MGSAVYAGPGPGAVTILSRTARQDTRAPIPAYGLGTARVYHMATMNGKTRNPNVESRKKPESQMTKNFRGDSRKTSLVRLSGIRFLSIFRHSSFGFWNLSALDGPAWSAMLGGAMSPVF